MEIFVASKSEHKIAAATEAARIAYPGKTLHVVGHKAKSGINEQPVGHDETLLGALNRLGDLKSIIRDTRFDLLIAMEGGMISVQMDGREQWFDCGWVVAENAEGDRGVAHCAGVRHLDVDVEAARAVGFATTTVGSKMAERIGASATDPHTFLTKGLINRTFILKQALLGALGQLKK